jgi:hypothetical protein
VMTWVALCVIAISTAYVLVQLTLFLAERRLLKATLALLTNGRFKDRDDLVRLKRYLSTQIQYDPRQVNNPRPILRHTAAHILKTGSGFCGENARVAIRLLGIAGVRAHRIYLEGARWQHVVAEHEWEGGWCLFDAHSDPATLLPDECVGRIESSDIARFPNCYEDNPWRRFYRVKLFHRLPALRRFEQTRSPRWIAQLVETPSLVRAGLGLLGTAAGLLILRMG